MGKHIPLTHMRGKRPICAVFATTGVETCGVCILPRKSGVGDHLCFLIDQTSDSVLGTDFPRIVRLSGRKLHCNAQRLVRNYNMDLKRLLLEHRMFSRMKDILAAERWLLEHDFEWIMNRWDDELTDYMLSTENNCHKFKIDHIEWSPKVGVWLPRR